MELLPSRRFVCTTYNHAPYHFMQSHIRKVHACLAVTCHLHFWQNQLKSVVFSDESSLSKVAQAPKVLVCLSSRIPLQTTLT